MQEKMNKGLKIFILVTFIAMVVTNALANIIPINGMTTGQVSDSYPNLFAPAGFTFSIWGVIYLLLAGHVLYHLGVFRDNNTSVNERALKRTSILFGVSSLANTGWILAWHFHQIALSTVLIVVLLICLIGIMNILRTEELSTRDKLLHLLPFSVYFGWITVATIANVTTLLVSIGWDGFGLSESFWTILILAVGTLIGVATSIRFNNIVYALVFIWSYFGILMKHTLASGFNGEYTMVIIAAAICIVVFAATIGYLIFSGRRKKID